MKKYLIIAVAVLAGVLIFSFLAFNSYKSRAFVENKRYVDIKKGLQVVPTPVPSFIANNSFYTSVVYTQPHGAYGRAWHYSDEKRYDEDMERIKSLGFDSVVYWGVNMQSIWNVDLVKLKNMAPYPSYFQVNESEFAKLTHFMEAAAKQNLRVNMLLAGGYNEPLVADPNQPSDWGGKAPGAKIGSLIYTGWPDAYYRAYADFHRFLAERFKNKNFGYMWIDDELFSPAETDPAKWNYLPKSIAQSYFYNAIRATKQGDPYAGTVLGYLNGGMNKINYKTPLTYGDAAVYLLTTMGKPYSSVPKNKYYDSFNSTESSIYYPYANALCDLGIECNGTEGKPRMFDPKAAARREGAATWLIRSKYGNYFPFQKTAYFKDVPSDYWAFSIVQKMKELGIDGGDLNGNFRPTDTITLGEFAQWLSIMYPQTAMFKPDQSVINIDKDLVWVPANFADTVGFDSYFLIPSSANDKTLPAYTPAQLEQVKQSLVKTVADSVAMYEPSSVPFFIPEGAVRDYINNTQLLSDAMNFYTGSLIPQYTAGSKNLKGWNYFTFRDTYSPSVMWQGSPDACREDLFGLMNINNDYKGSTVQLMTYLASKGKYTYAFGEPNNVKAGGFEKPIPSNRPVCYGKTLTRLNYVEDQLASWRLTNAAINDNAALSYEGYGYATIQPKGSINQEVQLLTSTAGHVYSLSLYAKGGRGGKMEVSILKADGAILQTYTKPLENDDTAMLKGFDRYELFLKLPAGSSKKAIVTITSGSSPLMVDNVDLHIRLPSSYK